MLNSNDHIWKGFIPPQYIYKNRKFKGVVLDPPNFVPGSWIGAGKALFDPSSKKYFLTARPRKAENKVRGYAVDIYQSDDGEKFEKIVSLSKEEVSEKSNLSIYSIEGTQILKDPLTGNWHLYISVDIGSHFIWGGIYWQTLLLTAPQINGPWKSIGLVLKNDRSYDVNQARDATIDIIDGRWICLYKAMDEKRFLRVGLAMSHDGIKWMKKGTLKIDSEEKNIFISGSIFSGTNGPLFIGTEINRGSEVSTESKDENYADKYHLPHGSGPLRNFVTYQLDSYHMNLELIFRIPWKPLSTYEYEKQPLLGYSSIVYDPQLKRFLIYVEALYKKYTKKFGINSTVEGLLLYETKIESINLI